jgi:hypothetical protein
MDKKNGGRQGPSDDRRNFFDVTMTVFSKQHSSIEGKSGRITRFKNHKIAQLKKAHNCTRSREYRLKNDASFGWSRRWRYRHPKEYKLWRRRQDHCRWIYRWVSEEPERTIFLTLEFRRYVTPEWAKVVGRRVVRWLKGKVVESWVRIVEQAAKRPHLHFLLRLKGSLDAASGLERIEIAILEHKRACEIGSWDTRAVTDPKGIAEYLTKTFRPKRWRNRVSGKAITYSQSIRREPWRREGSA